MKTVHLGYDHREKDIRILLKECVSLAAAGHDVTYITRASGEVCDFEYKGVHVIGLKRVHGLTAGRKFIKKDLLNAALTIDADVYHLHESSLMIIANKLIRKGKTTVFDAHEHYHGYAIASPVQLRNIVSPRRFALSILPHYFWRQIKRIAPRCAMVITASDGVGDEYDGINDRICILRNVPLLDDMSFSADDYMMRDAVFCYAGGVSRTRIIDRIVEAANSLDGCRFEYAGPAGDDFKSITCQTDTNSKYLGMLDRKGVSDLLGRSIAGMIVLPEHPNHMEPEVSNKLFEYMTAGLPVICSNFPKWQEFIDENQCGICVDPDNIDDIRSAMRYLMEHREEAMEMGRRGRKAIEEKYNWDIESSVLINAYAQLESFVRKK